MRLWTYIKSRNETLIVAVIAIVVVTPLIIWSSTHTIQSLISLDFKCPNDYKTVEEYVESLAKWIREKTDANPKITPDEIQKLRDKDTAEHKCEPSHWVSEEDVDMINKSLTSLAESTTTTDELVVFNLNITLAGTLYELSQYSQDGDIWLAKYNSRETSPDQFDKEIAVFYIPPYSTDANSDGGIATAKKIADNFASHMEQDDFVLLKPFSFPDPENSDRDIYVLTAYNLNEDENSSLIYFAITKQVDQGVFTILFSKKIENDEKTSSLNEKTLEWLNGHTKYMEKFEKFNPTDFLHEDMRKRIKKTNIDKITEGIKYAESQEPPRIGKSPNEEELNDSPYIKHIRLALNGYLNGTNAGVEEYALNDFGEGDCGLNNFNKSYYNGKFIIFNAYDGDIGGVQAEIVFVNKPDTIFWTWVYRTGGDENEAYRPEGSGGYVLRAFCKNGPAKERAVEFKDFIDKLIKTSKYSY